jgi:hypothetical protein
MSIQTGLFSRVHLTGFFLAGRAVLDSLAVAVRAGKPNSTF